MAPAALREALAPFRSTVTCPLRPHGAPSRIRDAPPVPPWGVGRKRLSPRWFRPVLMPAAGAVLVDHRAPAAGPRDHRCGVSSCGMGPGMVAEPHFHPRACAMMGS